MYESQNHHGFTNASRILFRPLDCKDPPGRPFIYDLELHEQVHLEPEAAKPMSQDDYNARYVYCSFLAVVRVTIGPFGLSGEGHYIATMYSRVLWTTAVWPFRPFRLCSGLALGQAPSLCSVHAD